MPARNPILAAVLAGLLTLAPDGKAQGTPDMIDWISGGTMSPRVELRLNLGDGVYHLVEPASATPSQQPVTHDGRVTQEALDDLRTLARKIVISGFKTRKCQMMERAQKQRDARRGILRYQPPNMDYQSQFWVNFERKSATAPDDSACWRPEGAALRRRAFQAVHSIFAEQ